MGIERGEREREENYKSMNGLVTGDLCAVEVRWTFFAYTRLLNTLSEQ